LRWNEFATVTIRALDGLLGCELQYPAPVFCDEVSW
jgi:hypothetical protein